MLLGSLLAIGLLSGCSTAYQSGQTPDDVYYSPGRDGVSKREEEKVKEQQERYEEYISSQDDRYLRMKVANRNRWAGIDDFDYWYDSRYDFCRFNNFSNWNNFQLWNNPWNIGFNNGIWRPQPGLGFGWGWNNPMYTVIVYASPKFYSGSTSGSNLAAYRNTKGFNNNNQGFYNPKTGSFNNSGSSNSFGSLLKRVFTPSNASAAASSFDRPVRSFSNSNGSSATPSSSAGGNSGGVKSSGSSAGSGRGGRGN